jgi:hypothetical protein
LEQHIPELVLGLSATVLVGALGFFLKRTLKEVSCIEIELKKEIKLIYQHIDGATRDIKNHHNSICHERQDSCTALMKVRFEHIAENVDHTCKKIAKLETNMKERWDKQERLNERLLKINGKN